jgi:hypothetical protein
MSLMIFIFETELIFHILLKSYMLPKQLPKTHIPNIYVFHTVHKGKLFPLRKPTNNPL